MLISFYGTLAGVTANILKGEAKITIGCKVEEMDDDTLDRLAEVCALLISSDVHLVYEGRQVALPCTVSSVLTDHAKKAIKVVVAVPEKRLEAQDKSYIEEWYRMEREIGVEITNRQMTFNDIVPQGARGRLESVTITHNDRSVTLRNASIDPVSDELIKQAIEVVRQSQRASASIIQRGLRVGYPLAARLLDRLEDMGVVGPYQGNGKDREVIGVKIDPGTGEVLE